MLRDIIDYRGRQVEAADQDTASPGLPARRKDAYAKVARHARVLLAESGG